MYTVQKNNKITYKKNYYSLPLGTYKGKNTKVFMKVTSDQLILMDQTQKKICRHDLCRLKGQKILATDHMRDKSAVIGQLILEFSQLMENQLQAFNWANQIKDHKPRYVRDQILLLKETVTGLDRHIASQALNYACQNQVVSGNDFKAITQALLRQQAKDLLPAIKIIQLNPLNSESRKLAGTMPQQSELSTYDTYFNLN